MMVIAVGTSFSSVEATVPVVTMASSRFAVTSIVTSARASCPAATSTARSPLA